MVNSRNKGVGFEREIANTLITAFGIPAIRLPLCGPEGMRKGREDIVAGRRGAVLKIQCKKQEWFSNKFWDWLAEGSELLVIGKNRKEPLVVLPLNSLLEISKKLIELSGEPCKKSVPSAGEL